MDRNNVLKITRRVGLFLLPLACLVGLSAAFEGAGGVAALAKGHAIYVIAIIANLAIGVLLATLQQDEKAEKYELQAYWATLIATAVLLPGTAALITVVTYLSKLAGGQGKHALFWGSAIAVWAWFAAAFACRWLAKAENAIPSSYGELGQRLTKLRDGLGQKLPESLKETAAFKEADGQKEEIEKELKRPGLPWVLARGYDNVWDRLYRAEEALIEVAPEETVVAEALYDELRLQDSKIDHRDYLCAKLRQAVAMIDPGAVNYLIPSVQAMTPLAITTASPLPEGAVNAPYKQTLLAAGGTPPYSWTATEKLPEWLKLDQKTGVLSGTPTLATIFSFTIRVTDSASQMTEKSFTLTIDSAAKTSATSLGEIERKAVARGVLRIVRRSINEYRGECWNGLIVARNRLLATMFFTALTAYALLLIALICKVDRCAVCAASAFYLVGAAIGLLSRLRSESLSEAAVEDYGLSAARLVTIPLLSGLTAIGGVVLVAMMPYATTVFGPTAAPAPAPPPLAISTSSPLPGGTVATAYSEALLATGGTPPYKWIVSEDGKGAMPDALTLSATGVLSGTPTNAGTGNFTVQVTDSLGVTVEKRFVLPISPPIQPSPSLTISTTSPLPGGTVEKEYSERLQATGGKPPYKWAINLSQGLKGAMPAGLALSDAGLLSGKPTEAKTFEFTVRVTDSAGVPADKSFTLPINQSEQAPAVTAAAKVPSAQRIPKLGEIFDLGKNLIGLLIAAVFGLTPGLLFDRLQELAEKYKSDLKSSQATQGVKKP